MTKLDLAVSCDKTTGTINSINLLGNELLNQEAPANHELIVNSIPAKAYLLPADKAHFMMGLPERARFDCEHFTDQYTGWALRLNRFMGGRPYMKHNCFGINYAVRRVKVGQEHYIDPGPGGPPIEAHLHAETLGLLNLNWQFWGDDTRMIFPSSHSQGPGHEHGHIGYENDTPEIAKSYLQNIWRRIYPGLMTIHGGLFYNCKTGHWLAITCRRADQGYILNLDNGGRGVSYDFTLHGAINMGDYIRMPEIKIYYGDTTGSMNEWMGDYITHYYQEPPEWFYKTVWGYGLAWNNQDTWTQQADYWEGLLDKKQMSGINYCLTINRPVPGGAYVTGYEPDPNHGTLEEFKAMCHRMADRGVPILIWLEHTGILPGGKDIDEDWFIRGVDGGMCASWGDDDWGLYHVNPGHPGYLEYTKKWIRFYIKECRCKGIFFDCLGWAFPTDYTHRSFMRYPGQTNVMRIKFMEEVYNCIKECDPEAIMMGEGTTLEAPVNVFSVAGNPVRAIDNMGPRDFLLNINKYAPRKMALDQGGTYFPALGMATIEEQLEHEERNRFFTEFIAQKGGRDAFTHLPGDISLIDDLVFVAKSLIHGPPNTVINVEYREIRLPAPWNDVTLLKEKFTGKEVKRDDDGAFRKVNWGIYEAKR